jgi:hypothetical protein
MRGSDELPEALRARIAELAAGEADDLLTEALARARARVLDELTDAVAESLRGHVGVAGSGPAPVATKNAGDGSGDRLGLYVYGVISAGDAPVIGALPGIEPGHRADALVEDHLAAVVSRVPLAEFSETALRTHLSDMSWVEATARAHEQTLELVARRATVIPMRMCSVYSSEDGLREMLRREAPALTDGLAQLAGKSEWGVKVFADSRLRRAGPPSDDGAFEAEDAPGAGAAYLARKREERDAAERAGELVEEAARQIHERLRAAAADGLTVALQPTEPGGPEMVLNAVYLVAGAQAEAFHQRVRELQDTFGPLGVELEQTGPWPAYNFVPGTIGAAW